MIARVGDGVTAIGRERVIAAALAMTVAAVYVSTLREGHRWGDDFAQYIQHGINIATGRPYAELPYVSWPIFERPGAYPPGTPILLAVAYHYRGLDLSALKAVGVVTFALALAAIYLALRDRLSRASRVGLVVLLAANPVFWDAKDEILSDLPFVLAIVLALWAIDQCLLADRGDRPWPDGVVAGLAMYLAFAVRVAGGVLPIAACLACVLSRRRITRAIGLAVAIAIALDYLQVRLVPGVQSYGAYSQYNVALWLHHTIFYAKTLTTMWDNGYGVTARYVLFIVTAALAAWGLLAGGHSRSRVWELCAGLLFLPGLLSPGTQGMRYLVPILPVFMLFMLIGIERVLGGRPPVWRTAACGMLIAAIGLTYAAKYSTLQIRGPLPGIADPAAQSLFAFVRQETTAHDVIEFRQPRALALFTGRSTAEYIDDATDEDQWRGLRDQRVTLLAIGVTDAPGWQDFVRRHAACWTGVFSTEPYQVYRVNDPSFAHPPCAPAVR